MSITELINKLGKENLSLTIDTIPLYYDNFLVKLNHKDMGSAECCIRWDHLNDEYVKDVLSFLKKKLIHQHTTLKSLGKNTKA